jgi:transcriptional regulator with XRE-family HTH domain
MCDISNIMKLALNARELGEQIRQERKARGRTQAWVAQRVGCRRQTIADLEAGRNVATSVLLRTAGALGKALTIVDARLELEQLKETFEDAN